MQRFLALEQVSVVLASCQPFFRRTCLVMTARILPKPCSAYLFAIGAHGLRHLFCPHLKPHKGYRKAISLITGCALCQMKRSFLIRAAPISSRQALTGCATCFVPALSRIRDIALRYPLSRAAPYKIKNQCSHPFLCEHKWVKTLVFNFSRLKPNVHIYTVGLPSGGLLLPGIVRLGVRCLF